ncbi:unnamed protein product [Blepharisma stoltei]|uniref:Uncharacterized protein n=1 Tax=Blepharisma stoltei TaxID=1481888 RepID=A0AAU9IPS0_9CILI|nr:unnamed protein product [Blepharisma stoltei]
MDLLSELIREKPISNFLKKFPEKEWLGVIKKTLMYGIQTFEIINNAGIVSFITSHKEREKLADIENLNIHERKISQPEVGIGENQPEDAKIKKQISKLRVNKPASTPRAQKMTPKAQNVTSPLRKMTFDPPLTSRNNARIKTSRNSSESKAKAIKKSSNGKKSSPSKEKLNLKTSNILIDSTEQLDLSMKNNDKSTSSSSTMNFSQILRNEFANGLQENVRKKLINIELNLDKVSQSALNYTTSPSDDD